MDEQQPEGTYRPPVLGPTVEKHRQDIRRLIVEAIRHTQRAHRSAQAMAGRSRLPWMREPRRRKK
jgi:hypothetical protein